MTDQDHAKIVRVTQADREAAALLYEAFPALSSSYNAAMKTAQFIRDGGGDGWNTVQMFTRHRLAAEAAAFEKAACVLEKAIGDGYEVPAVKGDQCVHGRFGWEDCIACYDEELLRTATAIRKLAGEKHD